MSNPNINELSRDNTVYVDESPIHGKGLFAKTFIPEGTVLGTIKGEYTNKNGDHVLWLNENTGFRVRCDFQFINHSETPNAVYYDSLEVCAIKDILPGEEITHNYEEGWKED